MCFVSDQMVLAVMLVLWLEVAVGLVVQWRGAFLLGGPASVALSWRWPDGKSNFLLPAVKPGRYSIGQIVASRPR